MVPETNTGKKYVDLHIHTKFSDGSCTVHEVVELAFAKGLKTISITDHDSIDAYPLVQKLGAGLGLEVIPGVELSSEIEGIDIHILGYCFDTNNRALRNRLRQMKEHRYRRAQQMVKNLNRQGIDLRFETVLKIAGEGAIGRPHIAAAMLREELVYSFKEAFDKFIGYDSPAYVEKLKLSPREVFQLILEAGGIPVLAHPGVTSVDDRIPEFIKDGLMGIEVYHSEHTVRKQRHYRHYCLEHDLAMTGGSDFHNPAQTKAEVGSPRVPFAVIRSLKQKRDLILARGSVT
jgi:hypothetical protein